MRTWLAAGVALVVANGAGQAQSRTTEQEMPARQLFVAACANCHGNDGRGATQSEVGFAQPLPDFTECSYASRETSQDWAAIVHGGGPVRGFSHIMPSFGAALTQDQIDRVVTYIRSLCGEKSWPRGELNFPRAMLTEKAFPEDEAVVATSSVSKNGLRSVETTVIYEKRLGARNQWELAIPFGVRQRSAAAGQRSWSGAQLGDIAVAFKRALYHNEDSRILSAGVEMILPTGDEESGAGSGVTILEPFVLAGQALPHNSFFQLHAGYETPLKSSDGGKAAYLRTATGITLANGAGRTWTPIVEVVADRELVSGAVTQWEWVPQLQVSLSKLQHVLASVGMRLPVNDHANRPREFVAYVIWDWFDGGFFSGW